MQQETFDRRQLSRVRRELLREQRALNTRRFFRNRQAVFGALVVLVMLLPKTAISAMASRVEGMALSPSQILMRILSSVG